LAASFPTLFSTASGVIGLVAGPSSAFRSLNYRVRLFGSLQLVVAPPVCEPGKDTSVTAYRVFTHEPRVGRCFWQRVGPVRRVSPLNSQVAFLSQVSAVVCNIADASEGFHGPCPDHVSFPVCVPVLSAFRRFSFGWPPERDRQSRAPVLMHSSNRLPSGNCDSLRLETCRSYLIRLGTVSHRSSSLSSRFANTDDARTPPEELVNPASALEPFGSASEGPSQPA
jgi:hypothetical protein